MTELMFSRRELEKTLSEIHFTIPEDVRILIDKYYKPGSVAWYYFLIHSLMVTELALKICQKNVHLNPDTGKVITGAMLHDAGIFMTDAAEIGCFGKFPYIAHGYLGRELLEKEGFREVAPVCERHVGVGFSLREIVEKKLPFPHRDMMPETIEEKIVCYADKFFSKSEKHLRVPKKIEKVRQKIHAYGEDKLEIFEGMVRLFGV